MEKRVQRAGIRHLSLLAALLLLVVLTGCAERGVPGVEYRWSSETSWHAEPDERPPGEEQFLVRTRIPDLGPRPAMRLYQPPMLQEVDVGDAPLDLGARWAVRALPPDSAGKWLTLRYHSRYSVPQPVLEFGSEDTLAARAVREDLAPFGIGIAMTLLGLGALASLLLRRARAWFLFGSFAVSVGAMMVLEVQDFYVLLPLATLRDPLHEGAIFAISASFVGFMAEVFPGRWARALRVLSISAACFGLLALALNAFGIIAARRLRFIAEAHIAAGLLLSLITTLPRRDRASRVFLVGVIVLIATGVPDMLTGLGLVEANTVHWGVAVFVMCIGYVLYGHYGQKEIELQQRVHDVEALNAELRHQIAERSREMARHVPGKTTVGELPKLGSIVASRYEVLRELGVGGMGHVFEVARSSDGVHFALKVMSGQSGPNAIRFAREAEIAAKLAHPNLVSVVDVGIGSSGLPFIVMELVRGGTLADRKLEREQIGPVLAAVARGLAALHDARIVHRDLKPSNVLVSDHEGALDVKLADFGIARALVSEFDATQPMAEYVTRAGQFLGTPLYMAPEQALGADRVAPAADIFSFGVMAYELFAGAVPFATPLVFLALSQAAFPEPPSFEPFLRDARTRELLRACLSQSPDARPSAEELARVLT